MTDLLRQTCPGLYGMETTTVSRTACLRSSENQCGPHDAVLMRKQRPMTGLVGRTLGGGVLQHTHTHTRREWTFLGRRPCCSR